MRRGLIFVLLLLTGCGGVQFGVHTLPANAVTTSGFVTIVQLTVVGDGNGSLINVTFVTLTQNGSAQTFTFCGSQSNLFFVNTNMQISFMPGASCATLVAAEKI
ncbi:MAG: hypothetical protein ACR2IF_09740 [Terriglobales bacterium]